jgi:Ca2+/Na+ antiporter
MERGMLDWINNWKRPLMGWVGIGGIAASVLIEHQDLKLRFVVLVISIGLLALALPSRFWQSWRTWFTD